MKILITGGTGFIGKRLLLKHIEMGDTVGLLTRQSDLSSFFEQDILNKIKIIQTDLNSPTGELAEYINSVDVIYHCAAEIKDENKMFSTNVQGTQKILSLIKESKIRWVQLSSVGAYGYQKQGKINEKFPDNPQNTYEVTKTQADKLVIEAGQKGNISYSILRPSNVFGIGMNNRSIYQLIKMIKKGLFFFIGKKGASANYVHVEDVVEALYLLGTHPNALNKIFIISDHTTLENFVSVIAKELGVKMPSVRLPKLFTLYAASILQCIPKSPLTVQRVRALSSFCVYENDLIQKDLGYQHKTGIIEGIKKMVQDWRRSV